MHRFAGAVEVRHYVASRLVCLLDSSRVDIL